MTACLCNNCNGTNGMITIFNNSESTSKVTRYWIPYSDYHPTSYLWTSSKCAGIYYGDSETKTGDMTLTGIRIYCHRNRAEKKTDNLLFLIKISFIRSNSFVCVCVCVCVCERERERETQRERQREPTVVYVPAFKLFNQLTNFH